MDLRLTDEGVLVLGVSRPDEEYLGAPRGHYQLAANDTVILYGPRQVLADLDERRAGSRGNWKHYVATERQQQVEVNEDRQLDNRAFTKYATSATDGA